MKKWIWVMVGVVAIGLSIVLFLEWSVQRYEPQEDFYGFLIPKAATVIKGDEQAAHFEWDAATFEHGIPLTYKYALKRKGWQRLEPIDTIQVFQKGNNQIHVLMSTDLLEIFKADGTEKMTESELEGWVTFISAIRSYFHYRTQAVIGNDIEILWTRYPLLAQNTDFQLGINVEQREVDTLNNGVTVIDANVDIENYDHIKTQVLNEKEAVIQVHGSLVYLKEDFEESGGEILMDIFLEKQDNGWTVVKVDEYTEAEYKEWFEEQF